MLKPVFIAWRRPDATWWWRPLRAPFLALAFAGLAMAVGSAQRGGGRGEAPVQKPFIPVYATLVAKNPDAYVGQNVTLTAFVDKVLSKSAFAVDQVVKNAPAAADILVLAPILNEPVEPTRYVTVAGELLKFDPAEVAKKAKGYQLDLPPDVVAKYRGRPAVIATVIVNDKMVDIAMRLPPGPMSAEEQALDDTMKKVGPAAAALRTAVDGSKSDVATQNLTILKQAFTKTEAFWKAKGVAEALKIAQDARARVEEIEKGTAAGDWAAAKKSVATLNQSCGACHTAYRERFDDGSFRVKLPQGR